MDKKSKTKKLSPKLALNISHMRFSIWHDDYKAIWILEMENDGHDTAYLDFENFNEETEEVYLEIDW